MPPPRRRTAAERPSLMSLKDTPESFAKQDTPLSEQASDEYPGLRVVKAGGVAAETYLGAFRFGAFDEISAWLEEM